MSRRERTLGRRQDVPQRQLTLRIGSAEGRAARAPLVESEPRPEPGAPVANDKINEDPRLDPRLKTILGTFPNREVKDVANREELLEQANTAEAKAMVAALNGFMEMSTTKPSRPRRDSPSARESSRPIRTATRSRSN